VLLSPSSSTSTVSSPGHWASQWSLPRVYGISPTFPVFSMQDIKLVPIKVLWETPLAGAERGVVIYRRYCGKESSIKHMIDTQCTRLVNGPRALAIIYDMTT